MNSMVNRIKNSLHSWSRFSILTLALSVFFGVVWLFALALNIYSVINISFLLMGLSGVLLICSLCMQLSRRNSNPFTFLLVVCALAFLFFMFRCNTLRVSYSSDEEPINEIYFTLQSVLDDPDSSDSLEENNYLRNSLQNIFDEGQYNYTLVLTDGEGRVQDSINHWHIGNATTLRPLVHEFSEEYLVFLIDGDDQLVSAFMADKNHMDDRYLSKGLVPSHPSSQPAQQDEVYNTFFPSFGYTIDQYLYDWSLLRARGYEISLHEFLETSGKTTYTIYGDYETRELESLQAAVSLLSQEEIDHLSAYAQWLEATLQTAKSNKTGIWNRSKMLMNSDGSQRLILLYENDNRSDSSLYPVYQTYLRQSPMVSFFESAALCMVPTFIVFLAFWVFVDARRRNLSRPALWAILTLIGNVVTLIIYLIVRPSSSTAAPKGLCPLCGTKLKNDYIACPGCGILLRNKCKNCGRALENDWSFCPYCTEPVHAGSAGQRSDTSLSVVDTESM